MYRKYSYVGDVNLRHNLSTESNRHKLVSGQLVKQWLQSTRQPHNPDNTITVTFIVDVDMQIWINDRHSEHVLCARGDDVLSAGEITFEISDTQIEVVAMTNQSTGYCPEPDSYPAVKSALEKTDIAHPLDFTTAYLFRRCENCGTINIVKDDWFVCGVCDADLSHEWNF